MKPDLSSKVREQMAGYRAANAFQLEEKRQRTPEERLRLAQVFMDRLAEMGRLPVREDKTAYYAMWQLLRERWLEQNATP